MPCMIAGASGGIAPPWLATMQRATGRGQPVEMLPFDAEVVLVDRVVEPPGEVARTLTATPGIHVGTTNVGVGVGRGRPLRYRDQIAGAAEHFGLGDKIEIRPRRILHVGTLGEVGHPEKPTGIGPAKQLSAGV